MFADNNIIFIFSIINITARLKAFVAITVAPLKTTGCHLMEQYLMMLTHLVSIIGLEIVVILLRRHQNPLVLLRKRPCGNCNTF